MSSNEFQRKSYRVMVAVESIQFEEEIWGKMLVEANLSEDYLPRFVAKNKYWDETRQNYALELVWYEVRDA